MTHLGRAVFPRWLGRLIPLDILRSKQTFSQTWVLTDSSLPASLIGETKLRHNKTLEMVWEASQDLGEQSDLFTGVLYDQYGPPPGFCWDLLCNDEPIMDSVLLENNLEIE